MPGKRSIRPPLAIVDGFFMMVKPLAPASTPSLVHGTLGDDRAPTTTGAPAWVEDAFARTGIRFIPVIDIEPAVTAIAWRPRSLTPLAERLLTIAAEHSAPGAAPAS